MTKTTRVVAEMNKTTGATNRRNVRAECDFNESFKMTNK